MKYFLAVFSVVILSGLITYAQDENFEKKEISVNIRDPFAYDRADSMYSVRDTLVYDAAAGKLISSISRNINRGFSVEESLIWIDLMKLEPYRKNKEVQIFIEKISKTIGKNIKLRSRYPADLNQSIAVSTKYKEKEFQTVTEIAREVLITDPLNLDVRNNLALAQMHLNNDLTSQLELLVLAETDSNYVPAHINLSVVYERLGKSKEAEYIAFNLLKKHSDIPSVVFNAIWYYNLNGDYKTADSLITASSENKEYSQYKVSGAGGRNKYESFFELNKKQMLYPELIKEREIIKKAQLLEVGFLDKIGWSEEPKMKILSIILFLIAAILFWRIVKYLNVSIVATIAIFVYILFWGEPVKWEWVYFVIFFALSVIFSLSPKRK
jgi:hypothetical protein